jgi:hypothetical protein
MHKMSELFILIDIVSNLVKELTGKSAKAKIGAFNLLGELATVVPDALDSHVASFVPGN